MKELLFFPLQLIGFVIGLAVLRMMLGYFNIAGLGPLLGYSLPTIAFIAFALGGKPKDIARSFAIIAFWFYSVLFACMSIAILA